jgi:hypothetical protein
MVAMELEGSPRRRSRLLAYGLAFLVPMLLMGPGVAHGQAGDMERARELMERGQGLYARASYAEAASAFEQAYAAMPLAAFLYNAGMAHAKADAPGKAADLFARYLAEEPDAQDAAEVRVQIDRLRTEQASRDNQGGIEVTTRTEKRTVRVDRGEGSRAVEPAPRPEPPTAPRAEDMKSMLSIQTTPRGATIRVHGPSGVVAKGRSPLVQTLAAGAYDVVIEKEGYRTVERAVTVAPGKAYAVIIEMSQGQFTGLLRVTSQPHGAQVFVDDPAQGPVGRTPWQGQLKAGEHQVWLALPGYETAKHTVDVPAGEETPLAVELERVAHGKVQVTANVRGARVLIDGRTVGEAPYEGDLDAGPHTVRVEAKGRKAWEQTVIVERGQLTPVKVQLQPKASRGSAWGTAVLSAVMLAGGTTLGVMSNNRLDTLQAEADAGRLASDDRRLFRGKMMAIGADVGFGVGGLLGLVALYLFVHDPAPDSEGTVLEPRNWTVDADVGPTRAGARFRWSF